VTSPRPAPADPVADEEPVLAWATEGPAPKSFGPGPVSTNHTIVVSSPAGSADRMPLTEVVDTLTMVPPVVNALDVLPFNPKSCTAERGRWKWSAAD
jgi:hypothetical protein